MYAITNQA